MPDVRALLVRHLAFASEHTPPGSVFALDVPALLHPAVTFFSARRDGHLLAVGALKELDERHGEVKSMHTTESARGHGVGRAMVDHICAVARARGYQRLSLETGSMAAFESARNLYARAGFVECGPFADYRDAPTSAFLTLALT